MKTGNSDSFVLSVFDIGGTSLQPWKYSGKEYDHRDGLDLYDYGARLYDPAAVRWTSPDPLCEKHYHLSPYVFCLNNPINAIDLNGDSAWSIKRDWEANDQKLFC